MIINLTPHTINVLMCDGRVCAFPPGPFLARVSEVIEVIGQIDGFDLRRHSYGAVTGLPEQFDGTWLIVSQMVAAAMPERRDLIFPSGLVRDEHGQPKGCLGFAQVPEVAS